MLSLQMKPKSYRLDGRCVYCLGRFEPDELTDEHIIPEAIHGRLVIVDGACVPCARNSNTKIDNLALNNDLLLARRSLELVGKRRRRVRPALKHLPPLMIRAGPMPGMGTERVTDLDPDDYPGSFVMLVPDIPGRLAGVTRGGSIANPRLYIVGRPPHFHPTHEIRQRFHTASLGLMLAKIGYCYAVAELGLEGFDGTEIRQLLLGARDDVYDFVGGCEETTNFTDREIHALYLRQRGRWQTVIVHLFASLKGPVYEVVVGER